MNVSTKAACVIMLAEKYVKVVTTNNDKQIRRKALSELDAAVSVWQRDLSEAERDELLTLVSGEHVTAKTPKRSLPDPTNRADHGNTGADAGGSTTGAKPKRGRGRPRKLPATDGPADAGGYGGRGGDEPAAAAGATSSGFSIDDD